MEVYVLFRANKKSGKIDTTMTALGNAMLQLWALQNTTSSKQCFIFERSTGKLVFATSGTKDGFPKVKDARKHGDLGTCDDLGIPFEALSEITDDRFDN